MMNIDWQAFTPWLSLGGGLVLGLAAALYLLGNGRIAGITSIVAAPLTALLRRQGQGLAAHRPALLFIAGLLIAPWLWQLFAPLPPVVSDASTVGLIAAGLLVGFGTRMANGCTSGHGVCGLSRLSPRSMVNVAVFMAAGFATVFVLRHVL